MVHSFMLGMLRHTALYVKFFVNSVEKTLSQLVPHSYRNMFPQLSTYKGKMHIVYMMVHKYLQSYATQTAIPPTQLIS